MKQTIWSLINKSLWSYLLLAAVALAGCGTFNVQVEPSESPPPATVEQFPAPTIIPSADPPTAVPSVTPAPAAAATEEADTQEDIFTLTGRAMTIDPPTGFVTLIPETETPFADSDGAVHVRISEWAHIVDNEGNIVNINDFSRGIKLELKLLFREGELTSEEVLVLEPGVPRPEDNPAYTDVTGQVTPLAETPLSGNGTIQLFEANGASDVVDPGSSVTLRWAFSGEPGSICVGQIPLPVTPTCYPELPQSGSMTVTVPEEAREAVIYSLFVQAGDQVEEAHVRLPLSEGLGCQTAWFFESEFLLPCAAGESAKVRPQAQNFERGMLLRIEEAWLGPDPYLFAFIWDEERGEYGFTEGPIADPWTAEMPEQTVWEEPPDGLFRPSRGLGLLWNGQVEIPQMGEPRTMHGLSLIGWATGPVYEYDAQYQCAEEQFSVRNCYLSLPDGQIVGLPGEAR